MQHIFQQVGPTFFKQAYRMLYCSFKSLALKLQHGIIKLLYMKRRRDNSSSAAVKIINYRWCAPNGPITPSVGLACALCYFAGGSPYNIMATYCIGYIEMMQSVWYVADAINAQPDLKISYPSGGHEEQHVMAESF